MLQGPQQNLAPQNIVNAADLFAHVDQFENPLPEDGVAPQNIVNDWNLNAEGVIDQANLNAFINHFFNPAAEDGDPNPDGANLNAQDGANLNAAENLFDVGLLGEWDPNFIDLNEGG